MNTNPKYHPNRYLVNAPMTTYFSHGIYLFNFFFVLFVSVSEHPEDHSRINGTTCSMFEIRSKIKIEIKRLVIVINMCLQIYTGNVVKNTTLSFYCYLENLW